MNAKFTSSRIMRSTLKGSSATCRSARPFESMHQLVRFVVHIRELECLMTLRLERSRKPLSEMLRKANAYIHMAMEGARSPDPAGFLVFERPAVQLVRDWFQHLSAGNAQTMPAIRWHLDLRSIVFCVRDYLSVLLNASYGAVAVAT